MRKNKRIIAIFLSLMMLISSGVFVNNAHAAQAKPTVYAHSYTVMDANSGEIIISEQENKRIYPASTIKLLTAIVAIENCSLYKRITVKKSTLNKVDVETTTAGLKPGYAYTLEELLNMLLVYSAGDAAEIIAESVGGTRENFVEMMNARAAELGMTNTTFRNACGLDTEGHLSTARDVAILSRYLLNTCPELLHYTGIWTDSLRNGQTQLVNTNKLLRRYSGITGLKTGTTSGAGVCISASATRDGLTLIAVVLGSPSSADRFHSATTLLDYGFANYAAAPLPTLPERPLALAVKGSAEDSVPLDYAALPETILIEKGTASALRAELTLPEALEAPVEKGRTVGKVSIFQDDTLLNEYEVKAAADAPLLTFGGALELLWQCLLGA